MDYKKMRAALLIINECNSLTITEEDKRLIIHVLGTIIKELGSEITTEISAHYALLKIATWNNGYFCELAKRLCNDLYAMVNIWAEVLKICSE